MKDRRTNEMKTASFVSRVVDQIPREASFSAEAESYGRCPLNEQSGTYVFKSYKEGRERESALAPSLYACASI